MIEDEDDPCMQEAVANLNLLLKRYISSTEIKLDRDGLYAIELLAERIRKEWRAHGVKLPAMVLCPLIRQKVVKIYRADLNREAVQTHIMNLTREYPDITMEEIAWGIKYAWPDYGREAWASGASRN